jgi:hypothetical protein
LPMPSRPAPDAITAACGCLAYPSSPAWRLPSCGVPTARSRSSTRCRSPRTSSTKPVIACSGTRCSALLQVGDKRAVQERLLCHPRPSPQPAIQLVRVPAEVLVQRHDLLHDIAGSYPVLPRLIQRACDRVRALWESRFPELRPAA